MSKTPDKAIYDEYPWILASAEPGYRWLPLRLALSEFNEMGADTIIMHETGLLVRIRLVYEWYAWDAEYLTSMRNKGFYAESLMAELRKT